MDQALAPHAAPTPASSSIWAVPCSRTPGAHARLAVVASARFQHDGVDALEVQEMREQEPGRAGFHDPDLRADGMDASAGVRSARVLRVRDRAKP